MTTITVDASEKYAVVIGKDIIKSTGEYIKNIASPEKIAIITDDKVDALYSKQLEKALVGYEVIKYVFENGEKSKNAENYINILEFLAENRITRNDMIIALGGGVVGDIAGFSAATFLRGIKFIQIPTTLLAAVDSSVGGKTAIDLQAGKNLAGAFYQPSLVICDYSTLATLDGNIFSDGCAEIIKYAVLGDKALFEHLQENAKDFDLEYVISTCVKMKSDIVKKDEFDRGERQLLNLGHTVGHAIELCSKFEISHGSAVAIGMAIVARACEKFGLCVENTATSIEDVLNKFELPTKTDFSTEQLLDIALSDKKRSGKNINLILPERIGKCRIEKTDISKLADFIKAGL